MFTGIVRERGRVSSFDGGRLVLETSVPAAVGDSIAVDGVCLTVVAGDDATLVFDVVPETLARSALAAAEAGTLVNVEPALRLGDELGGHIVQGHVDAVGRVRSSELEGDGRRMWIEAPSEVLRTCVVKGSIAVSGVALTIAELSADAFAVALVPHTLATTTLGDLAPGDEVNLEADVIGKYVERLLAAPGYPSRDAALAETTRTAPFATIEEAIEDIRNGKFVVVCDAPDRENEGDLTIAAEHATPEAVNFMATHGRGLICLCLTEDRCDQLGLHLLASSRESRHGTAYTNPIDAREGITTGVSAADRSHTILRALDPAAGPHDFIEGGHVQPLRARAGGVLQRAGQTEASVDLARLAGLQPGGVVCEIMNDDGTMARVPDLIDYCERHGLKLVTVADLIEYRRRTEKLVERVSSVRLPTEYGEFTAVAFRETLTGKHHVALVQGEVSGSEDVLVRVHSECLTGDVFHSLRCDCGEQLELALTQIGAADCGVLLYMGQEGRGIGLLNKLLAYELQEQGFDTVEANAELGFPADPREYGIGNQILSDLGLTSIQLLTNNPRKMEGIEAYGLTVTRQVPIEVPPNAENRRYLAAKRDKLGHVLHHQDLKFKR